MIRAPVEERLGDRPAAVAQVALLAVPLEGPAGSLASLAARWAVGRHCRVNPDTVVIQRDGWGRPYVAWPGGLGVDFSLSHSGRWVACALTGLGRVGVDVQAVAELNPAGIRSSLSPAEENLLWRRPPASRPRLLAALWTLKEAHLKCRGGKPSRSLASAGLGAIGAPEWADRGALSTPEWGGRGLSGPPEVPGPWRVAWYDLDGRHLLALCARPAQPLPPAPVVVTLQTILDTWPDPGRAEMTPKVEPASSGG